MSARTIRTPKGKHISPAQYVARVYRMIDPPCCRHLHFGCAAWDRGPCSDEVGSVPATPSPEEVAAARKCAGLSDA